MHSDGALQTVSAETLGSRFVFLPTYRFHRGPESLIVQPIGNLREVVGHLEIVRPAANDCRSSFKADGNAFLHWTIAKDLAQSMLDIGDSLAAYPDFG